MKNLISIRDFSRIDIDLLIKHATEIKKNPTFTKSINREDKIASLFFENSTRTRISSETAAINSGYYINGFTGVEGTSVKKGEPLLDTMKMLEGYGYKAIIMRHNLAGAGRFAADNLSIPVINAGDGSNGHPTQTLLDLFTIQETQGKIDGVKIALVGDLKYGRTVHSLLQACELYDVEVTLVSPPNLGMPKWRIEDYQNSTGSKVILSTDLEDVCKKVDILYMTRIQRERFPAGIEGELEFKKVCDIYHLTKDMLNGCKKNLSILHPLPRNKNNIEVSMDIDSTPHAKYFEQAKNGLFMREAIIQKLLANELKGKERAPINKTENLWKDLAIVHGTKSGDKLIYRLDSGTLIDHIERGKGQLVYKLLGLEKLTENEVVCAMNINSGKLKKKDVIAVHAKDLSPEQLYRVALISEEHTINIIKDKRVIKKGKAILPPVLKDLIICKNPLCVSRCEHNESAPSIFYVESQEPLRVRCHYCEQTEERDTVEFKTP